MSESYQSEYPFEMTPQRPRFKIVEGDDVEAHDRLRLFNARVEGG